MTFEEEEAAHAAARDELIDAFRAWTSGGDDVGHDVGTLLDFKFGYLDGELFMWHVEDLGEFFVDFVPGNVTIADDLVPELISEIEAFFTYLGASKQLRARSDPLPHLLQAVRELGAGLGARMADPSHWSTGKALLHAMEADGVDIGDQPAMDAWIQEFNAGPLERREAVLGPVPAAPDLDADDESHGLAPRPRPDPDAVAAVAAAAPILTTMLALSEYLGAGRPTTKKGNLKVADATTLVELLATGDETEATIGDHTYRTRSAEQLPRLDTIMRWAKEARVIRVVKGSLQGTAAFRKLARDPVAALDRLVNALMEVGPLLMHRPWVIPVWADAELFTDAAVAGILVTAYETGELLEFEHLVERTAAQGFRYVDPQWQMGEELLERKVRGDLVAAVGGLADAGVIVHEGYEEHAERYSRVPTRIGGVVRLTAYGVATVQRLASGWGFEAPVLEPFEPTTDADPVTLIRALHVQLVGGGPAALVAAFDSLGALGADRVVTSWRIDDPGVLPVLEGLGRHHLDKPVAKSARKAVLQHRSWLANRG